MPEFVVEHVDSRVFAVSAGDADEACRLIADARGFAAYELKARPKPVPELEMSVPIFLIIALSLLAAAIVAALL